MNKGVKIDETGPRKFRFPNNPNPNQESFSTSKNPGIKPNVEKRDPSIRNIA